MLKDLGIWDEVAERRRPAPNGATAMRALADSKSRQPIGCTQATEILATPGIVLVASLPTGCELATVYSSAITTKSQVPAEAAELIALLTGDAGRDIRERLGFV